MIQEISRISLYCSHEKVEITYFDGQNCGQIPGNVYGAPK
jgi:hypothetical protein